MEVMLKRDLIEYPFAWVYIGVGLILALVELITVVLACAYIAQINRSRKQRFTLVLKTRYIFSLQRSMLWYTL